MPHNVCVTGRSAGTHSEKTDVERSESLHSARCQLLFLLLTHILLLVPVQGILVHSNKARHYINSCNRLQPLFYPECTSLWIKATEKLISRATSLYSSSLQTRWYIYSCVTNTSEGRGKLLILIFFLFDFVFRKNWLGIQMVQICSTFLLFTLLGGFKNAEKKCSDQDFLISSRKALSMVICWEIYTMWLSTIKKTSAAKI